MKKKNSIDNVLRLAEKQVITEKLYIKRFLPKESKPTQMAKVLATGVATDANTALYVIEYNKGNFSAREDYIDYIADRIQFLMNGGRL